MSSKNHYFLSLLLYRVCIFFSSNSDPDQMNTLTHTQKKYKKNFLAAFSQLFSAFFFQIAAMQPFYSINIDISSYYCLTKKCVFCFSSNLFFRLFLFFFLFYPSSHLRTPLHYCLDDWNVAYDWNILSKYWWWPKTHV